MDQYIYLGDIDGWTLTHPEVVARLPAGYAWTIAGSDGAWCEPIEG